MFENSGITSSLNRVKTNLNDSLKSYYIENQEINDEILRIQGLHKDNFDFIKNMETLISSNIADTSIDTNSNKNEVTMSGLLSEVSNPINKLVGYRYLYRTMKDMYGEDKAKDLSGKMYNMSLALADSTKILSPYCYAIDASKIVIEGRPFGQLPSAPPNRLSSYIAALNETVHQLSNHLAGALAIGSFFFDIAHVLTYREHITLDSLKNDASIRKYIENCFQNFVHSVNHLSRNSVESPFSNISIFDKTKLKAFLSNDNMGWYFNEPIPGIENTVEYIIDYIQELQSIFMDFFDKGDPVNNGKPFRFPVVTINISKNTNGEIKIIDKDFLKVVCKHEIYRYNILVSEGSKVASCCRLLSDSDMMEIGGQSNSFGGSGISLGSHRVVTLNFNRFALESKSYDDYLRILNERIEDSAMILASHKALIKKTIELGLQPFMKNGWIRLDRMFSTFGVLGLIEAQETLKKKFNVSIDVIKDSLILLNDKVKVLASTYKIVPNIEQIPAESMAIKLATVDRLLFGSKLVPYQLYANQFVPLWENATLWERMDKDGMYNKLYTGGGICHFGLGEKVTSKQAQKIIEYAVVSGCEHFALNSVYSECENKHVNFGNIETCPDCGKQIIEKYTRVVGFFTPISSWNKTRREWEFPKRSFNLID